MKKAFLLILSAMVLLVACGKSLDDVKVGMSEQEVEGLLGKPNSSSSSSTSSDVNGEEVTASSVAEWSYLGKGTINFENGKVVKISKK